MFRVTSALLLHPLPYRDSRPPDDPLEHVAGPQHRTGPVLRRTVLRRPQRALGFEDVAIAIGANYNLTGVGEPERIGTIEVSSNLLPLLGAQPLAGRLFTSADNVPGAPLAAILDYGTWTRRFGGDPNAVGRPLKLNGKPYTVVGSPPRAFSLPQEVMPTLGRVEDAENPGAATARCFVRRTARARGLWREDYNVSPDSGRRLRRAGAGVDERPDGTVRRDYPELYPPNGGLTFQIVPLLEQVVGDSRRTLWMLVAALGFVLMIACSNVANLLLSRAVRGRTRLPCEQPLAQAADASYASC